MLLNAAMLLERAAHLQAGSHERTATRTGYANGFKPRGLQTSLGALDLRLPQARECEEPFRTSLLEKGSRIERSLKAAIAEMYLQGVSTRRVSTVMEQLCGLEVTSTQVSRLTAELDGEFEKWRTRALPAIIFLILGATYIKVRLDGAVRDCAVLTAIGICRDTGKRMVLGVSAAISEAEPHWRRFLASLKARGIGIPDLVTSDAHGGLKAALRSTLNATPWQRCQFHLQQSENCRRRLRTSNMSENLNLQIKRRTRVAGLFPNEASVLRLVTAILMETSEEWETGRAYLSLTQRD